MPEISVVIPLYNKGPYIARAIQSVLNQTEQSFEIIIVEGRSTDEGPKVVKSFKDQRIFFFEQGGSGVSAARNEGVSHSQSDFIAFLDADDEWMPTHLETLLRLKKSMPEAGLYCTAYKVIEISGRIRDVKIEGVPNPPWEGIIPSFFRTAALAENPSWTSVVGIRKEVFQEAGGFPENVWYGEDTYLWGIIALKHPIAFSWDIGAIYYKDASNRTCHRLEPIQENIFVNTAKKAIQSGEVPPGVSVDLQAYIARKQIELAYRNLIIGEPGLARHNLRECNSKHLIGWRYLILLFTYLPPRLFSQFVRLKDFLKERSVIKHKAI